MVHPIDVMKAFLIPHFYLNSNPEGIMYLCNAHLISFRSVSITSQDSRWRLGLNPGSHFLFFFLCTTFCSLVILLVRRIRRACLCVMTAMTSFRHFCDHLMGCKSVAERPRPHPTRPCPPTIHRAGNSCISTCSAARSLSPPSSSSSSTSSSPMPLVIHTTHPHSEPP